jgi:ubiquinone biosynthesis O-methyltransferase
MNVCRVQYILDPRKHYRPETSSTAHLPLQGLRALDIGCGGGLLSESLVRLGAQTTGIDPSTQLVEAAKQHAKAHLHPHQYDNQQLQYHGGITVEQYLETILGSASTPTSPLLFDIVCCLEVIEHVPDPTSLLQAATQLLKPKGLLFISSINQTMTSYLLTIVGAEYIFRWIPIGTHSYQQYKSPAQVQQLLSSSSLSDSNQETMRPINVSGMVIPPLCLPAVVLHNQWHWKLDPNDTDVNWIACFQKETTGKQ